MKTKLSAAMLCTQSGTDMVIANGSDPTLLYGISEGEEIGTKFHKKEKTL